MSANKQSIVPLVGIGTVMLAGMFVSIARASPGAWEVRSARLLQPVQQPAGESVVRSSKMGR